MDEEERMMRTTERAIEATSQQNRETLREFIALKRSQGLRTSSIMHYARWIQRFDEHIVPTLFPLVSETSCVTFMSRLRAEGLGHSTVNQAATLLKAFLRWVRREDRLPVGIREALKTRDNPNLETNPVVKDADFRKMLDSAPRLRDQALLAVLWESGFRVSECLSLNIGSVEFDQQGGAWLHLPKDGRNLKSGPRHVYVALFPKLIRAWMEAHPSRNNGSAPVFIGRGSRIMGNRLSKQAVGHTLSRICRIAGVARVNAHRFRHTAATRDSEAGFNEQDLRDKYGWSRGSKMPGRYVHHSLEHRERMARRAVGLDGSRPAATMAPSGGARELDMRDAFRAWLLGERG